MCYLEEITHGVKQGGGCRICVPFVYENEGSQRTEPGTDCQET